MSGHVVPGQTPGGRKVLVELAHKGDRKRRPAARKAFVNFILDGIPAEPVPAGTEEDYRAE